MGEFNGSGAGRGKGLMWALQDVITAGNFTIAMIAALIGYLVVEYLRKKL
jgi:hypothetical protein